MISVKQPRWDASALEHAFRLIEAGRTVAQAMVETATALHLPPVSTQHIAQRYRAKKLADAATAVDLER